MVLLDSNSSDGEEDKEERITEISKFFLMAIEDSSSSRNKVKKNKAKKPLHECQKEGCKNTFEKTGKQVFCSRSCVGQHRKSNKGEPILSNDPSLTPGYERCIIEACGTIFKKKDRYHVCCSKNCKKANKVRANRIRKGVLECEDEECTNTFIDSRM